MNIKVNTKLIKEMCGTVSFKRGASFFRTNKVVFNYYGAKRCQATVMGTESFAVTIEKGTKGEILTNCSCPKLVSIEQDCQHIAAVLLAINEHQLHGTSPIEAGADDAVNQELTAGLASLFHTQPPAPSLQQLYFENRKVLPITFICKPFILGSGESIIGIEIVLGTIKVENIRFFLEQLVEGNPCSLTASFTFDQSCYCFLKEDDAVIQELSQLIRDEKIFVHHLPSKDMLILPPSSWERMLPLLIKAPLVKLKQDGKLFAGLLVSHESLPFEFNFSETDSNGYHLKISGLDKTNMLAAYHCVLYDGKFYQLDSRECKRLVELKQMLEASGTKTISISERQIGYFLEKIAPQLKKVGTVSISPELTQRFMKTPLTAKLYLDRVKNRLLAGLEFHYENIMIKPLENREPAGGTMLIRDSEKEAEIQKLMDESGFAKTEGGYFLHNEVLEYEFLYHVVPRLQKLVRVYATTAVRNRIFRGNARPMVRVKVKKERINWLEFKFEMDSIPQSQIKEVLVALEEKRKYYRLHNGSLLSLETREMKEIQRFLQMPEVKNKDLSNGLDLPVEQCLPLLDDVAVSDLFKLEESFRCFLENLKHPGSLEFKVPEPLETVLRDYQKAGFRWMKTLAFYGFGGILADDMGLGKTVQSIAFILSGLSEIRKKNLPVLIVCPAAVTYNWLSEIMKFVPDLQAAVIDGSKAERSMLQQELTDFDCIITSYPLLRRDIKWYEKQAFYTVFFDEAQAFKNPLTQTARAVKRLKANHRFALTGTPMENSIEELWAIFHVVFPELFRGLKEYSKLTKENIASRIKPFLLRRLKKDVLAELPVKVESIEAVELLPEQKKLYAAYLAKLRHDTLKHLDKETIRKNRIKILAGLTRLRQICCHPGLFVDGYKGGSGKLEQLLQIVRESQFSGRRVLIFSQFTKMLELIGRELTAAGMPFFYLHGQTPPQERTVICNRFNARERDLLLISLKAGGTGLNLMTADTVVLYDTWWNPAVEEQAADRAYRMGQKNDVQVIKLVARGTIEEKINELQEKKRHLIETILDPEEKMLSAMSLEDIRELLAGK